MTATISHWVNGEVFTGTSGASAPVTNPATGAVTGQVALASVDDARAVIDAAAAAFPAWRDASLAKRTQVLGVVLNKCRYDDPSAGYGYEAYE